MYMSVRMSVSLSTFKLIGCWLYDVMPSFVVLLSNEVGSAD